MLDGYVGLKCLFCILLDFKLGKKKFCLDSDFFFGVDVLNFRFFRVSCVWLFLCVIGDLFWFWNEDGDLFLNLCSVLFSMWGGIYLSWLFCCEVFGLIFFLCLLKNLGLGLDLLLFVFFNLLLLYLCLVVLGCMFR